MTAGADQLHMFAKYWAPGSVKTRLARAIGAAAASRLYREMLVTLLRRLDQLADRRVLVYWPPERMSSFAAVAGSRWCLEPQVEGDLGARMKQHLAHCLASGARRVVLIGSDSPTLPTARIREAFSLLRDYPLVLGPTHDGGYYLIGLRDILPPVFEGVAWGTPQVWPDTIRRLQASGHPHAELTPWYDVDDQADLQCLRAEVGALVATDASWLPLWSLLRQLAPSPLGGNPPPSRT